MGCFAEKRRRCWHSERIGVFLIAAVIGQGVALGWELGEPLPEGVDYRHIHRKPAEALFGGDYKMAIAWCERFLEENPNDAEGHFLYAGALANVGKLDAAIAEVKKAVEAGLPPGRFWAGRREVYAPLVGSEAFQNYIASVQRTPRLVHGPMVGAVGPHTAKIWARTRGTSAVTVTAISQNGGEVVRSQPASSDAGTDFTAVTELRHLTPDTRYQYWLALDGERVAKAPSGQFQTPPATGQSSIFKIAFGGGAAYKPSHEDLWSVIASRRPDAFLTLGDNVYIDAPENRAYQRYKYYRRQSNPHWRQLTSNTPTYSIWDDHDFGRNDGSGGPEVKTPAWKPRVWEVFRQNWANPSYGGGSDQPGCWYAFTRGEVEFFMLDCRYYRTDPGSTPAGERSMLGPRQREWLLKALKGSEATFKVLCSSVPWAEGTKPGSLDTWDGFPQEREEIFSFIEAEGIDGVVLISADRHRHDVWEIKRKEGPSFYEFESSRLTNVHRHRTMEEAVFSYNRRGFGMVTFDTTRADPRVHYEIVNASNETVYGFHLNWSQTQR